MSKLNRKIMWRLMPFLMLCYFVNYLDRSNLSVAAAGGLTAELGLTATTYGLASGIFFIGYIVLEIPSNLALHKFGARKWIARILVSWGLVASLVAFVPNAEWLFGLRFLLGIAEAGFTPGIILYLTYWFNQRNRAQANSLFLVGIPLSSVLGAPLASWLISIGHNALFGLSGWRFMVLMTGIPAVLLGVMCWYYLTDKPQEARWLSEDERNLLAAELGTQTTEHQEASVRSLLKSGRAWLLGLGYFGLVFGLYAIAFFLPTIIKGFEAQYGVKYSILDVGFLTAIPYVFASIALLLWAAYARRRGDVSVPIAISAGVAAVGILIALLANSPFLTLLGITLVAMGVCSGIPLFFGLPTKFTVGAAAAAAVALVNTIGNFGGFAGPYIFGFMKDATGTNATGLILIASMCLLSGAIALWTRRWRNV